MEVRPWGHFRPNSFFSFCLQLLASLPQSYLGRRVFYALRRIIVLLLGKSPIDVIRLGGARLRLRMMGNVCETRILCNENYFDFDERTYLKTLLRPGSVFIDAGANVGGYSFDMGFSQPGIKIIAIEADPYMFSRLKENIDFNLEISISPLNYALSAERGRLSLFRNELNAGENLIRVVSNEKSSIIVDARSLLDIVQECKIACIDVLKIDIEGAEDEVLESFFRKADPHLFPEHILIEKSFDRWKFDVIELLKNQGYRIAVDFDNNVALQKIAAHSARL